MSVLDLLTSYNGIPTEGNGLPAIYSQGRVLGYTAVGGATVPVAMYTASVDGSFLVSMNFLVTAFIGGNVTGVVTYTDDGGTARSLKVNFNSVAGVFSPTVAAVGAFAGAVLHIRAKALTPITCTVVPSAFNGTCNVEGYITQIG